MSVSNRPRKLIGLCWPLLVLAFFGALFLLRAWVVEDHYGQALACQGCFFIPAIIQDLWLLAIAAALLLVVVLAPWQFLSLLASMGLGALFLAYAADVYILHAFGIRLFLADVALYGLNASLIFEQFSSWAGGPFLTALILAGLLALALAPALLPRSYTPRVNLVVAGFGLAAVTTAAWTEDPDFVNSWIYANFLQANAYTTESVPYSEAEAERHKHLYEDRFPARCVNTEIDRRNVIILLVESLSNYQSRLFGGHLDWTPALDTVAARNVRFTRVHAGGFSTVEGLINILGGARLWAPFQHLFNSIGFSNAWGIENSLVRSFRTAGYHTAFLSTGPLNFLDWGEWLADVGFDYIEGNQHPFYRDWPKVSFHAAADEALYRRALDWIKTESEQPYLLVLETVSTHQPFINPDTGEYDMEATFRYADRWAAWFYDQLKAKGYFEEGILVILGDHRSMTPVTSEEQEHFGVEAASLIPLILIDHQWPGSSVVERVHGQADLLPGFRQRLFGEVCLDSVQTSLFEGPDAPPGCAFHLRGTPRGIVDVFCDEGWGQVRLDGDDTRFVYSNGLSGQRREHLLNVIAIERLKGLERTRPAVR